MSACSRGIAAAIAILALSAPVSAAKYTPEQIQQAIKDLGDRSFSVREKASRLLWNAGADAEGALRQALKNGDAETTRRAKALLDKFAWGIYSDTSPAVVEQINRYRDGDRNVRLQVASKLMAMGQPGYRVVKRLAEMETDPAQKQAIYSKIAENAHRGVPALLIAGDFAAAEDLLDHCLLGDTDAAYTNVAAYHRLRGTVDQAIVKASSEWAKTSSKTAGKLLVHLYRVKPDFPKAASIAGEMGNDALVEQVLWEQGNWSALTQRVRKEGLGPRDASSLGMKAAVARLAGDSRIFDQAVAELKKLAESNDRFEVGSACESLLLVGKHAEALSILAQRRTNVALAFDLLTARMQYGEALTLARQAKDLDRDEQFALDLSRARLLHQLGENEAALQLFGQLGSELKELGDNNSARDLVKAMARVGLKGQASEQCARFIALMQAQGASDGFAELLEPLFGKDKDAADVWWAFLRARQPNEEPARTMATLRSLFEGKPVEKREDWAKSVADLVEPLTPVPIEQLGPDANAKANPAVAAAIVMERSGNAKAAEAYLRKAVARRPESAGFVALGDFLGRTNRFREAADAFGRAIKIEPGNALLLFLRGWALKCDGDEMEGKRLMDLAHWVPLGNEQDRGNFAKELDRRGFAADAARERDLVLNAGWYRSWHVGNVLDDAGRAALRNRQYAQAVAYYEKAIAGCMRHGASFLDRRSYLSAPQWVVQVRVRQLLSEKKFDDAIRQIRDSLQALPGNIEILIGSIPSLDAAGKKGEADALFAEVALRLEKAAQAYPNSGFLHNSYAWLAVNCHRELDKAEAHAQKAVALAPKADEYLDTLSEVYFQKGDAGKAVEIMRKCMKLRPNHAYYQKQLERFIKGDVHVPVPEGDDE